MFRLRALSKVRAVTVSMVNTFVALRLPTAAPFRGIMLIDARTDRVQAAVGCLKATTFDPDLGSKGDF